MSLLNRPQRVKIDCFLLRIVPVNSLISDERKTSELMSGKYLGHYHVQNEQDYDKNGYDVVMMQRQL